MAKRRTIDMVKSQVIYKDYSKDSERTALISGENLSHMFGKIARWYTDISWVGHKHVVADITDFPALGTAASKDVPASGDAENDEVVMGNDSRLTDARTPTSHTHSVSEITDFPTLGTAAGYDVSSSGDASNNEVVLGNDSRLTDARTPLSHTHTEADITNLGTYAGASIKGGAATSANKLNIGNSDIGNSTTPVYFDSETGLPIALEYTIEKSVPADAVFTDTTYSTMGPSGSSHAGGLVPDTPSTAGTSKYLREDGTWAVPPNSEYVHPSYTPYSSGLYKITVDTLGHVSAASTVTGADLPSHSHTVSDITNFPTLGTAAGYDVPATGDADDDEVVLGNDSRLSDARTPLSHTHTEADISDLGTYAGSSTKGGAATSANKLNIGSSDIGSETKPVYFSASSGKPVACVYSLNASVPANAVFTDTNVKQSPSTANESREVLFAGNTGNTETVGTTGKSNKLYFNPSTGALTATSFSGSVDASNLTGSIDAARLPNSGVTANSYGPAAGGTLTYGGTFDVPYVTVDKYGRLTAASTKTFTMPAQYAHPTYISKTSGLYKITVDNLGHVSATAAVTGTDLPAHSHTLNMATSTGSSSITLAANTKYQLTAGGSTYIFTTPADTVYTHPTYTEKTNGLYKITVDELGHVSATAAVTASDLPSHTHPYLPDTTKYAGSSSVGGAATSANKLNIGSSNIGNSTTPVYFNSTTGLPVALNYTIEKSVPADAKFTDTVYTHPTYTAKASGLYKITVDELGHVSAASAVTGTDLPSHSHNLSMTSSTGTSQISLSANTKYQLTAGGSTYIFTTPADNNTTYTVASGDNNGQIKITPSSGDAYNVSVKGLGSAAYTNSSAYATSGHTHTLKIEASSGTSSITLLNNTKYQITAGGSTYVFTTPTGTAVTYTIETGDNNGQIKMVPSSGSAYNVSVKGLGSAAYANTSDFAPASHSHDYLPLSGGTLTGMLTIKTSAFEKVQIYRSGSSNNAAIHFYNDSQSITKNCLGSIAMSGNPNGGLVRYSGDGSTSWKILDTSNTSITQVLASGTKIATIKINGVSTDLYCQTNTNTTYTIATGDNNGQIKVTPSSGSAYNVSVKGLGSAAYTNSSAYAAASHTHTYLTDPGDSTYTIEVAWKGASVPASETSYPAVYTSYNKSAGVTYRIKEMSWADFRTSLGLGSAAYTNSSAYAAASHTHSSITGTQKHDAAVPTSTVGTGIFTMFYNVDNPTGNMPKINNANAILQFSRHDGEHDSQLGFSSDGNIYYRYEAGSALTTSSPWKQLAWKDDRMGANSDGSYWGMTTPNDESDAWIRTTSYGIIPYQSGGAGSGHSSLGTSAWYFDSAFIDNIYGTLHGRAVYADNSYVLVTDPSSKGTYGIVFVADPSITEDNTLRKSNSIKINHFVGAANTEGITELILGNSVAKSSAGNSSGHLTLYNSNGKWAEIYPNASATADYNLYLPASTGTLALVGDNNHTHNYAGSSSAGGAATSANKLNTNAGSNVSPVYFSSGKPVACKQVASGAYFSTVPYVRSDGVMDIGRYLDFHTSNTSTSLGYRIDQWTTNCIEFYSPGTNNRVNIFTAGSGYAQLSFQLSASNKAYTATGIVVNPLTTTGTVMRIESGGNMIVGAGESPSTLYSNDYDSCASSEQERLYLAADGDIVFVTNTDTYANRKEVILDADGNFRIGPSQYIIQTQNSTSNYTDLVQWWKGGTNPGNYGPSIGHHNTGDTDGAIILLPYHTSSTPWSCEVGLYISKTRLWYNGTAVSLNGHTHNYIPNTDVGLSAAINLLSVGDSDPVDDDYYVSQIAGGGTTSTSYHRRPVSKLWNYIKGKADSVYAAKSHSHSYIESKANYAFTSSTLPNSFDWGVSAGFVNSNSGFGSYGSVLTVRTYTGGGGTLQLYAPYSPTYGGTHLKARFGNYDSSSGNSWTSLRELAWNDDKLGANSDGSYWGMTSPSNDASVWIRTTSLGIIPYQSGGAGSGHCGLGTSSWYFSYAYIDTVYGSLSGRASEASNCVCNYFSTDSYTTNVSYAILFAADPTITEVNSLRKTYDMRVNYFLGAANTEGLVELVLGNNRAKSSANNASGHLSLYNANGKCAEIFPGSNSSDIYLTLPSSAGTLALVGDNNHTHSYLPLSGGTMTGNITFTGVTSTSYPTSSNQLYWSGSTDWAKIYYRVDASDAGRLVFDIGDDTNTRIDFAYNGTTKSYIDTNGKFSGTAAKADVWTTARTLTIGSTGKSVNGSSNVSWSLSEIGAAAASHDHGRIVKNSTISYGASQLQWFDLSGNGTVSASTAYNPSNDWYHHIMLNHANSGGYYIDLAICFHADAFYYKRIVNGSIANASRNNGWVRVLDQYNYGSYVTPNGIGAAPSGHTHAYAGSTTVGGDALTSLSLRLTHDNEVNCSKISPSYSNIWFFYRWSDGATEDATGSKYIDSIWFGNGNGAGSNTSVGKFANLVFNNINQGTLRHGGSASSWWNDRNAAMVYQTDKTANYLPIWGCRTNSDGSWCCGNHNGDNLYFNFIPKSVYDSGANPSYYRQIYFTSDAKIEARGYNIINNGSGRLIMDYSGIAMYNSRSGGWADGIDMYNSQNTLVSSIGFYGVDNALQYTYIGGSYAIPLLKIEPSTAVTTIYGTEPYLYIVSSNHTNAGIVLQRGSSSDTYTDYRIINLGGDFKIQSNVESDVYANWFDMMTIAYSTGDTTVKGNLRSGGDITIPEGYSIKLRPNHSGYYAGIGYDTVGNECIAMWAKNTVTRLRWHAGIDMSSSTYNQMISLTNPDFEISKASGTALGYIGGRQIVRSQVLFSGSTTITSGKEKTTITLTDTVSPFGFVAIRFYYSGNPAGYCETIVSSYNNNWMSGVFAVNPGGGAPGTYNACKTIGVYVNNSAQMSFNCDANLIIYNITGYCEG